MSAGWLPVFRGDSELGAVGKMQDQRGSLSLTRLYAIKFYPLLVKDNLVFCFALPVAGRQNLAID